MAFHFTSGLDWGCKKKCYIVQCTYIIGQVAVPEDALHSILCQPFGELHNALDNDTGAQMLLIHNNFGQIIILVNLHKVILVPAYS